MLQLLKCENRGIGFIRGQLFPFVQRSRRVEQRSQFCLFNCLHTNGQWVEECQVRNRKSALSWAQAIFQIAWSIIQSWCSVAWKPFLSYALEFSAFIVRAKSWCGKKTAREFVQNDANRKNLFGNTTPASSSFARASFPYNRSLSFDFYYITFLRLFVCNLFAHRFRCWEFVNCL